MTENLPLIPNKRGCVGDVRGVLREVFRERATRLPPLPAPQPPPPPGTTHRIATGCPCACACDDPAHAAEQEDDLRSERGHRLARAAALHPYKLRETVEPAPTTDHCKLLQRSDLMPRLDQNAARTTTLWIKNILNRSSGDLSELPVTGSRLLPRACPTPATECRSEQSLSIGNVIIPRSEPTLPTLPPPPPPQALPRHIVCIPPSLTFVNFSPGNCYTQSLRLVNMSKLALVLSVRPPARRELDLQLCGRLKVTAGHDTEMLVHFTPVDVRTLQDLVFVRVSEGRAINIPISCYIQPPVLDVLMPNLELCMLSCALEDTTYVPTESEAQLVRQESSDAQVLDLGARLLGDVHSARLVLRCLLDHVTFCLITEDAWMSHNLSEIIICRLGALVSGSFVVSPAHWRGGGENNGIAWCRATVAGLHHAALRLVCTNAVTRPLNLIADALYFYPEHITLQAHEKTYDICSDSDPDCEYYVNVGTTFPHQSLTSSVLILNHSPLSYSYYWSVRPWGKCSCWQEELVASTWLGAEDDAERLCPGARVSRADAAAAAEAAEAAEAAGGAAGEASSASSRDAAAALVRVESARGVVAPRSSTPLHVVVPDVGDRLGTQRAVLVLVLKDIPQKSFPRGFYPMIVSTNTVKTEHIPGLKSEDRVMCDVVCCQLEVWWHVAPLRFVLDPPLLMLHYSRRVPSVDVAVRATQLYAGDSVHGTWHCSRADAALPPAPVLQVAGPHFAVVKLPLPELPNEASATETITLEEERGRWSSTAVVVRECATRHPALRPHSTWLGVVPPGHHMCTTLTIHNDTHQDIYWWGDVHRVLLERWPYEVCVKQIKPCKMCKERPCACSLLRPMRGFVPRDQDAQIKYDGVAPDEDGCVVTLVRVRRTAADTARLPYDSAVNARGALIAYRVLAPRVTLKVTYCGSESHDCEIGCAIEECDGAVLRPTRPLVAGLRTCYRLHLTNLTPIKTHVKWDEPPDGDNTLRTFFIPNEFDMVGFEEVDIRVVLEARRVCGRRIWVRRAVLQHAYEPLYLLIDACISGLDVDYWLPLPNYSFCLRRKQRETFPWSKPLPTTEEEAFAWEDAKRAVFREDLCRCKPHMQWVEPPAPEHFPGHATPPIPIVSSPPPLTRLCKCVACARPKRPSPEPLALEVRELPLKTVHTLRVRMRSVCPLAARWSARARLGSLEPTRTLRTTGEDRWAALVRECGVCVRVSPVRGVLGARAEQDIELRVYADSWGLYRDQILILLEGLEPLVLNLWVQAVGTPLQFALRPRGVDHFNDNPPLLWVSKEDPEHTVRAKNTSRAPLLVHAYLLRDHEHIQEAYPFRLCVRLFDMLPPVCPCVFTYDHSTASVPGEASAPPSLPTVSADSMDTGVEVYLAPDYGIQDSDYFKVEPIELEVPAGGVAEWRVRMLPPLPHTPSTPSALPPDHTLLLRIQPLEPHGPWWFRDEPRAATMKVRGVMRAGASGALQTRTGVLQISRDSVIVYLTGLDLPYNELLRVRKRILVQNIGNGRLMMSVCVSKETVEQVVEASKIDVKKKPDISLEDYSKSETDWRPIDTGNVSLAGDIFKIDDVEPLHMPSAASSGEGGGGGGPKWSLVRGERRGGCGYGCEPKKRVARQQDIELNLSARSATELCVELAIRAEDVVPPRWGGIKGVAGCIPGLEGVEGKEEQLPARYEEYKTFTSHLQFYDDDNVLRSLPLVLQLQLPHVVAMPPTLELGYVCDGDTRKTYFTVSHTCRHNNVTVFATWLGGLEFRIHPTCLRLPPGVKQNVYVIYTARYTGAVAEGWVELRASGTAGAWCCAAVRVRARASRDYKCHLPAHDHTDDPILLPLDLHLR